MLKKFGVKFDYMSEYRYIKTAYLENISKKELK